MRILALSNRSSLILLSATKQNSEIAKSTCLNINGNLATFTEEEKAKIYPLLEKTYLTNVTGIPKFGF